MSLDANFIDWATAPSDRTERFWALVRKRNTYRHWRNETRRCEKCGGVRLTDDPLCAKCKRALLAEKGVPSKRLRQVKFARRLPVTQPIEVVYGQLAYRTPVPYGGGR